MNARFMIMDTDNNKRMEQVREALDNYMEGRNTQQELKLLKDYFDSAEEIPEDLVPYRELFALLDKETAKPSAEALVRLAQSGTPRRARVWPWIAAACVAVLAVVLTAPPRHTPEPAVRLVDGITAAVDTASGRTESREAVAVSTVPADTTVNVETQPDAVEPSGTSVRKPSRPAPRSVIPDLKTSVSEESLASQDIDLQSLPMKGGTDGLLPDDGEVVPSLPMRLSEEFEQQLATLEQQFREQDDAYIRSLMDNDKEANLAVKAKYISLL